MSGGLLRIQIALRSHSGSRESSFRLISYTVRSTGVGLTDTIIIIIIIEMEL
jgi:hypothetical protein